VGVMQKKINSAFKGIFITLYWVIQNDKYKKTGLDAVSPFLIGIQAVSKLQPKLYRT
jgi:hypothetical protein